MSGTTGNGVTPRLRNMVGQVFALECGLRELWTDEGPVDELRGKLEARTLPPAQTVLMRFALDFYDGSGGGLGLAEAVNGLSEMRRDGMEALFFLAEFIGSAMTDLPGSLEDYVQQYLEDFAAQRTQ